MAMRPEDIPRRRERLILADASYRFFVLCIKRFFHDDIDHMATFLDSIHVMRVLWSSTCRGQSLTAQQIGHSVGMPRQTVQRKLEYLLQKGYVERDGTKYAISADTLMTIRPELDQVIKLVCDAADALRAAQNGQEKT